MCMFKGKMCCYKICLYLKYHCQYWAQKPSISWTPLPLVATSNMDLSLTLDCWCVQIWSPRQRAQSRWPQRQQQQRAVACWALLKARRSWRDTKPESTRGCTAAPSATRSSRTAATWTDTSAHMVRKDQAHACVWGITQFKCIQNLAWVYV